VLPVLATLVVGALVTQTPPCPDSLIASAQARAEDLARRHGCTSGCLIPQPAPGKPLPIPTVADLLALADTIASHCREGDVQECTRLGRQVGYAPLVTCGARHYSRACVAGSGVDCLDLSELYAGWPGWSRKQKARAAPLRRRGITLLDKGCNAGVINDCEALLARLSAIYEDTIQARVERRLCELGRTGECLPAADRNGVRGSPLAARLLERGCSAPQPSGLACYFLAQAYGSGGGVPRDTTKAAELRKRACALDRSTCGQCAPYGCPKREPQRPRPP
jgi:hypothetical protein